MADQQKRVRSPKFPFIDLKTALEKADTFYQSEKRNSASVPVAMKVWGYNDKSSGGLQTISALKEFGLMEDSGSGDGRRVKLTDRALRINLDKREGDAQDRSKLIKESALLPKIHSNLWQQYQGELPSDSNLRHSLMFDYETPFNENTVDDFITQFRSTLSFAKLTASDSISSDAKDTVQNESAVEKDTEMQEVQQHQPLAKQQPPPLGKLPLPPPAQGAFQDVFSLSEGPVTIQWPASLSPESYEDLAAWLDILKRKIGRSVQPKERHAVSLNPKDAVHEE